MKPTKKAIRKDKLDHICDLVDLEWNGMITRDELVRRLTAICEYKPIIELYSIETEYRCVEQTVTDDDTNEILSKGYFLQYRHYRGKDEWSDVTDLTELKVWQYNKLVDELNKHYPDYPIEHLEGRFV